MPTDPATEELNKFRKEIKHKLVRARAAYACCRKGFARSALFLEQFRAAVQWAHDHPVVDQALTIEIAPLPRLEPWVVAKTLPVAEMLQIGIVDVKQGTSLLGMDIPYTQAEMRLINQFVGLAVDTLTRQRDDCMACIRKAVLSQRKKRKRGTWTSTDGQKNEMRIRIEHE
jgi:hypothetical protein